MTTPWKTLLVAAFVAAAPAPLAAQQTITLQQAVDLALSQSNQARAAKATLEASRYRTQGVNARLLPQLSVGGQVPAYSRSIIPVIQPDGSTQFLPLEQTNATLTAQLSQTLPVIGGNLYFQSSLARLALSGTQATERWSSTPFTVGLRQDIFRPNNSAWDVRAQSVTSERDERQYRETRENIALQATNLFFDVYAARVALTNATKNAAVNDTLFTLNKGRFDVGKIGENDLLQSELALLRSRATLDGAKLEFDRAAAALRLGLNLPVGGALDAVASREVPDFTADTTQAVSEAMKNRAAVSEVELADVQARRSINDARLRSGVGATLSASYGYNATAAQASLAYQNLLEARNLTLAVSMPLFQWGAHGDDVRSAEAERDRVASNGKTTLGQTAQDAHFAALQLAQARRSLVLSAKADTVAGKRYEVAYNRYVIGKIALDNLFLAQNEKDQAATQFVQALRGYWQAYYRLRQVTLYDFEKGQVIR
jgi:outer membrane protein TolC